MRTIKLLLTLLLISGFFASSIATAWEAGPCDKEQVKRLLKIPFDTVGLRSMAQVSARRALLKCSDDENGPFAQAFQEVTGESLKQFASRSGNGMSSNKSVFPVTSDDLSPESSLTYKTKSFSTIPVEVQVYGSVRFSVSS